MLGDAGISLVRKKYTVLGVVLVFFPNRLADFIHNFSIASFFKFYLLFFLCYQAALKDNDVLLASPASEALLSQLFLKPAETAIT